MNTIFDDNGHLTDYAMNVLIKEDPEELIRLEIAEHLAFCDKCLENYTTLLTPDILFIPDTSKQTIYKNIKTKINVFQLNRYISIITAACFAITLWVAGAFNIKPRELNMAELNSTLTITNQNISDFTNNISNTIKNSLEFLNINNLKQEEL